MLYVVGGVRGVTRLGNIMYVICERSSTILLYSTDTYSPLDVVINVDGMERPTDVVVCSDDRQLFVAEYDCIWRVSVDHHSDQEKWLSTKSTTHTFHVHRLSVTSRRLLVTSLWSHRLHQYSTTDRQLLRVVSLQNAMMMAVKGLYHGVETTRGTFVVCYQGTSHDKSRQYAVSVLFRFCT